MGRERISFAAPQACISSCFNITPVNLMYQQSKVETNHIMCVQMNGHHDAIKRV